MENFGQSLKTLVAQVKRVKNKLSGQIDEVEKKLSEKIDGVDGKVKEHMELTETVKSDLDMVQATNEVIEVRVLDVDSRITYVQRGLQLLCSVVGESLSGNKNGALGTPLKDFAKKELPRTPSQRLQSQEDKRQQLQRSRTTPHDEGGGATGGTDRVLGTQGEMTTREEEEEEEEEQGRGRRERITEMEAQGESLELSFDRHRLFSSDDSDDSPISEEPDSGGTDEEDISYDDYNIEADTVEARLKAIQRFSVGLKTFNSAASEARESVDKSRSPKARASPRKRRTPRKMSSSSGSKFTN